MKFDMTEVQITFPVGSWVTVKDTMFYSGFRAQYLKGQVMMIDAGSGVCVKLFITTFFEPCMWFDPYTLGTSTDVQVLPPSAPQLEQVLGGRRSNFSAMNGKLIHGTLVAWLVAKARARPGQGVYDAARKASWNDCVTMFRETDDRPLMRWLEANDTRVKRAQLIESDETLEVWTPKVKRPMIG